MQNNSIKELKEMAYHDKFYHSNVVMLMLDTSKASDRVDLWEYFNRLSGYTQNLSTL